MPAEVRIADDEQIPQPRWQVDTAFFWESGADGYLRIQRCGSCGRYAHPPTPRCRACGSDAQGPSVVSGRATVFTFTVNEQTFIPWLPAPYVLAIVSLAEQQDIHLTTRVVDCDPMAMRIGLEVNVLFERHGTTYLPLFRPVPL
jgi:uncharacterized OB-fold protein